MTAGLATQLALAAAMAVAGLLGGRLYFAGLRRTVAALAGGRGHLQALMLTLGRLGGAVVGLLLAAEGGPLALLAAFAGFLLARALATRPARVR